MRAGTMRALALMGDGWTSTADLARLDGRTRERMASLLRRLEAAGYVESRPEGGRVTPARRMWRATGKAPDGGTQADRVRGALRPEWRSTRDIMDESGASRAVAQSVLNRMVLAGQAVKRVDGAGRTRRAMWRLAP